MMNKLKIWIKKIKFKLFKRERGKFVKTNIRYTDQFKGWEGVTLSIKGYIPYEQFIRSETFTTYRGSSVYTFGSTYLAYWDEEGFLCREDTQGYHNSKL